jgi:hypothetical protein
MYTTCNAVAQWNVEIAQGERSRVQDRRDMIAVSVLFLNRKRATAMFKTALPMGRNFEEGGRGDRTPILFDPVVVAWAEEEGERASE